MIDLFMKRGLAFRFKRLTHRVHPVDLGMSRKAKLSPESNASTNCKIPQTCVYNIPNNVCQHNEAWVG